MGFERGAMVPHLPLNCPVRVLNRTTHNIGLDVQGSWKTLNEASRRSQITFHKRLKPSNSFADVLVSCPFDQFRTVQPKRLAPCLDERSDCQWWGRICLSHITLQGSAIHQGGLGGPLPLLFPTTSPFSRTTLPRIRQVAEATPSLDANRILPRSVKTVKSGNFLSFSIVSSYPCSTRVR
jgi:hypothetical protein